VFIYSRIMFAGPHYVVGQDGKLVQVCPEKYITWHVGASGHGVYRRNEWTKKVQWWLSRWTQYGVNSPLELASGKLWLGGSCNANTVGIEVVPPEHDVRAPWPDAAMQTVTGLIKDVAARYSIPVSPTHIMTHSDAHPLPRSANNNPWDTVAEQWNPEMVQLLNAEKEAA
jgi:N-acetyl-anhydromuramyl-L-alanine amidase AmpD